MGREVRRVPQDWAHPKDAGGHFIPLHDGSVSQRQRDWDAGEKQWTSGFRDDYHGGWKPLEGDEKEMEFADWEGARPEVEDYMPDWPEEKKTHYQMYENTTEGTPISPIMAAPEELARWLVNNGASAFAGQTADYESWLRVCQGGYAPSAVSVPGIGLVSGVQGLTKK